VAQAGKPECIRFPDRELDIPIAGRQLLLRCRAGVGTTVASRRFLQYRACAVDRHVDEICPHYLLVLGIDSEVNRYEGEHSRQRTSTSRAE
jgi:hypothetical protein